MKKPPSHMVQDVQNTTLLRVIGERFDRIESRIEGIDSRMGSVESHMGNIDSRMGNMESRMATKEDVAKLEKGQSGMKKDIKEIRHSLARLAETSPTLTSFQQLETKVNRLYANAV